MLLKKNIYKKRYNLKLKSDLNCDMDTKLRIKLKTMF